MPSTYARSLQPVQQAVWEEWEATFPEVAQVDPLGHEVCVPIEKLELLGAVGGRVLKMGVENKDDLVPRLFVVDEEVFKNAERAQVANRLAEFLDKFPLQCVDSPFAEFDSPTERSPSDKLAGAVLDRHQQQFVPASDKTGGNYAHARLCCWVLAHEWLRQLLQEAR